MRMNGRKGKLVALLLTLFLLVSPFECSAMIAGVQGNFTATSAGPSSRSAVRRYEGGIAGKTEEDKAAYYYFGKEEKGYLCGVSESEDVLRDPNATAYCKERFLVLDMDVVLISGGGEFFVSTADLIPLTNDKIKNLPIGEWSHIRAVIEPQTRYGTASNTTQYAKASLYLNNTRIGKSDYRVPVNTTGDGRYLYSEREYWLRVTAGQDGIEFYTDNLRAWATDTDPMASAEPDGKIVQLNCLNDAGDYTFFDSRYCVTSGGARYSNLTADTGNNYINLYRLDYKNPDNKDFIYMERLTENDPCNVEIKLTRNTLTSFPYRLYPYFLMGGKLKRNITDCAVELFSVRAPDGTLHPTVTLNPDGTFAFSDNTVSEVSVAANVWNDYKMALNVKSHTADVYVNGTKIKAGLAIDSDMKYVAAVRWGLYPGGTGNIFWDELSVIGLESPYLDGVDTLTSIYPDEYEVREYLKDKTAFHAYSGLMYRDGVKTPVQPKPIYDKEERELYISADFLKNIFPIEQLTVAGDGSVAVNGKTLSVKSMAEENIIYLPLKCLAEEVFGKYVFSFETGFFVLSDKEEKLSTNDWRYQATRADENPLSIPLWNDIDHLNAFLQYERPDESKLAADFSSTIGVDGQHPRVILNAEQFSVLREQYQNDADYKKIVDDYIFQAECLMRNPALTYTYDDSLRMINTAHALEQRMYMWGFAWQMTSDEAFVNRAYREIEAIAQFPDYNMAHIIDTGFFAAALAIGYDWFYDGFTDEQREFVRNVCRKQCLLPLASGMYGRMSAGGQGFVAFRQNSNFNSIVTGGVIMAALSTAEQNDAESFRIVKEALRGMEYSLAGLMPEGGWNESPSYWNYGFSRAVPAMFTLQNCCGSDYGLSDSMGMKSTLDYVLACIGVTGINNFHDTSASNAHSYSLFFPLSQLHDNSVAYQLRKKDVLERKVQTDIGDVLFYRTECGEGQTPTGLITRGTELFSLRDTWGDDASFYFSTHFGSVDGYHQHNDCSTFVLDMLGERWAEDLGSDDYNLQNERGYQDWELYRKRAEGHNVFVINPEKYSKSFEQISDGEVFVPISDYKFSDNAAYVSADLASAYADASELKVTYQAQSATPSLTIKGEMNLAENSNVYWFMHTKAAITIDGADAYLQIGGKRVKVTAQVDGAEFQWSQMAAQPLPTSPNPAGQNKNADYRKLALRFQGSNKISVTINIAPVES